MAAWTSEDIPNLTGRVAVVTGANSGLGLETARRLSQHGAEVIMACRDRDRCSAAAEVIEHASRPARPEPLLLDLADLNSVRAFAKQVRLRHATLDILVNNAGVMATPRRLFTRQGFELQFGTNHLGHFALTGLLLPLMLRTPGSRVVTVSSFAHVAGAIRFDDLQLERSYSPYGAYNQSKLANLLFALELDRRFRRAGADTLSVGVHPGLVHTNLQATGPFIGGGSLSAKLVLAAVQVFGRSAERGAEPQLYAATAPGVQSGQYIGPRRWMRDVPSAAHMSARARNEHDAERLWEESCRLTGVDIDGIMAAAR